MPSLSVRIRESRTFVIVFTLVLIMSCSRFVTFRLIPAVDLPNHLAVATIVKSAHVPNHHFADFFVVDNLLKPSTFHSGFCSLFVFPSVEFANRVYLLLYSLLLPLATLGFLLRLKGNLWFAILPVALINNYNLCWGFVGFSMAIPVCLLLLHAVLNYASSRKLIWAGVTGALLVVLFFVHVQAMLFGGLFVAVAFALNRRGWVKGLLASAIALLPAALLTVYWWVGRQSYAGEGDIEYLNGFYATQYLPTLANRALELVTLDNTFLYTGIKGLVVASILGIAVLLLGLVPCVRAKTRMENGDRRLGARVVLTFVAVALVCFFVLPPKLPGQDYLYQRFACIVLLGIVVLGGVVSPSKLHLSMRLLIVAVAISSSLFWHDYFADFNRSNRSFRADVFPVESPQSATAAFVFKYFYRGQHMYLQLPNYHTVWNEGVIATAIVDYRFSIVRRKPGGKAVPRFNQMAGVYPSLFQRSDIDAKYVVAFGEPPQSLRRWFSGLRPMRASGGWRLWENPGYRDSGS